MKQVQAFLNDVERFCDSPGCEGLIHQGDLAVHEYRTFGHDRYHHQKCWLMYHPVKEVGK